jgi:hypothetical protein
MPPKSLQQRDRMPCLCLQAVRAETLAEAANTLSGLPASR